MKLNRQAFLIDDDSVLNAVHCKFFKKIKLFQQVTAFDDPVEAMARLSETALLTPDQFPEYIFLDIYMPLLDGWEFLKLLSAFPDPVLQKTQVLILTSSIDLFDIRKAKSFKLVRDYIIKPLDERVITLLSSPKHTPFSISQSAVNAI